VEPSDGSEGKRARYTGRTPITLRVWWVVSRREWDRLRVALGRGGARGGGVLGGGEALELGCEGLVE
jgi:hypothetical protein